MKTPVLVSVAALSTPSPVAEMETRDDQLEDSLLRPREVKAAARLVFRSNLATCVIVSVLAALLIWPIVSLSYVVSTSNDILATGFRILHWTRAQSFLTSMQTAIADLTRWTSVGDDASAGVLSTVYNSVKSSGSVEQAALYAVSHAIFHTSVSTSIIAVASLILTAAVTLLLRVPLRISSLRFYLETRLYPGTPMSRLLFIFRHRRTGAIAWASVYKTWWLVVWSLTVVMIPVKYYSYFMFDYIMAENPHANPREALKLSQAMMRGNKLRTFRLDLSFLGWYVLGLVTFGVVLYFYAMPYRSLAMAELYVRIRQESAGLARMQLCDDRYLVERPEDVDKVTEAGATTVLVAPTRVDQGRGHRGEVASRALTPADLDAEVYPDPHGVGLLSIYHADYRRDYSVVNLVLFFFCFSLIGWLYESVLSPAFVGSFVNKGMLYGPWLPIYGTGGLAALLWLKKLRDRPILTFLVSMALCGTIEYVVAMVIYHLRGVAYWSYDGFFFNIQGRICLEGLLMFGLGCSAAIYLLAPMLDTWLNRIPRSRRYALALGLTLIFLVDAVFAILLPRTGAGLTF
ncbi:MAG: DUF975 family protein [Propionibacteriaceae bacterium]|nr:DUF975 family protein [Propionibacteriaceae bacterium]